MNLWLIFTTLLAVLASAFATDGNSTSKGTSGGKFTGKKKFVGREGRQLGFGGGLGYGGQTAGLQSALQGISSGYGYGYNNAVGLGGMGLNNGYGLAVPFGIGR